MKKKWYACFEYVQFSIIMLLVGQVLISIGNIGVENEILKNILLGAQYMGGIIRSLFPFVFSINYIGQKNKDGVSVVATIISFVLLEVCTMFFNSNTYDACFYDTSLPMSISIMKNGVAILKQPLNLGLIGSAIVILIVDKTYEVSRKRYNYGFLSFIDNDTWFMILMFLGTIIAGAAVSYSYPFFSTKIMQFMERISNNSANPAVMFCYGITREFTRICGLSNITTSNFWMDDLGGSWIDSSNVIFYGDINIWTAQYESSAVLNGVGKYLSGEYVINLFAVPSLIIAYLFNINNKIEREKMGGMVVLVILASFMGAATLPVEIILLFTAPVIILFWVGLIGLAYMIMSIFSICLGYSFTSDLLYALPGNIIDYFNYFRSVNHHKSALAIMIIGILIAIVIQVMMWCYYHYLAQDFLEPEDKKNECHRMVTALGGMENIKMITSSIISIIVVLKDKDKLNTEALLNGRVFKIKERYFGFILEYGPGSAELSRMIKNEIRDFNECKNFNTNKEGIHE